LPIIFFCFTETTKLLWPKINSAQNEKLALVVSPFKDIIDAMILQVLDTFLCAWAFEDWKTVSRMMEKRGLCGNRL